MVIDQIVAGLAAGFGPMFAGRVYRDAYSMRRNYHYPALLIEDGAVSAGSDGPVGYAYRRAAVQMSVYAGPDDVGPLSEAVHSVMTGLPDVTHIELLQHKPLRPEGNPGLRGQLLVYEIQYRVEETSL